MNVSLSITAPTLPGNAAQQMPENTQSFSGGIQEILLDILPRIRPALVEGFGICLALLAIVLLISLLDNASGDHSSVIHMAGAAAIGTLLLSSASTLIHLGVDTVNSLSEYGKLLLPVMTAAMAAQGAAGTSAALYAGTALFSAVLSAVITKLVVPMLYIFLCLSIASAATGQESLKQLQGFVKWLMTWCLKIVLYVFTGYMSITGVVSGSVDAAAIKAAKLTISGMVPVVGSILSDASETVLVGAGVIKNTAGVYGLLALITLWIHPFIQIGAQYLLLKVTGAVTSVFSNSSAAKLIGNFSEAMGFLVAMTGTVCLLLLVSTVCFMRGVG